MLQETLHFSETHFAFVLFLAYTYDFALQNKRKSDGEMHKRVLSKKSHFDGEAYKKELKKKQQ